MTKTVFVTLINKYSDEIYLQAKFTVKFYRVHYALNLQHGGGGKIYKICDSLELFDKIVKLG